MFPPTDAPCRWTHRRVGFTLVELLVTMVVLALIAVMLVQLTNRAALSVTQGARLMEVDGEARLVLDRLAFDFAGMLRRDDVDYSFVRQTGDDFLSFYTETQAGQASGGVPSTAAPRTAACVGVRINANSNSTNYRRLERAAMDLSGTGMTFAPLRGGVYAPLLMPPNTLPTIPDDQYHVLGIQVFRFEICFLYNDPNKTATDPSKVALRTQLPANATLGNLSALVVTIVVLDTQGRRLITAAQLDTLHAAFPDPDTLAPAPAAPDYILARDVASLWGDVILAPTFAPGVPAPIRQAVRVYQRYYFLH